MVPPTLHGQSTGALPTPLRYCCAAFDSSTLSPSWWKPQWYVRRLVLRIIITKTQQPTIPKLSRSIMLVLNTSAALNPHNLVAAITPLRMQLKKRVTVSPR